jgi:Domain of unknown function (DUF4062)
LPQVNKGEAMKDERFEPHQYPGVMVSSTFSDLKQHRAALMRAIEAQGLHTVAMEHDAALPDGTVIDSSLRKVRDATAYIGVISHKYGQIPDSAEMNPNGLSLTELEFREARDLSRPILIFIMGEDHDVKPADVERDPDKAAKLEAFREEVKRAAADSRVQRVYKEFNSLHEFEVAATQSMAELRRFLDAPREPGTAGRPYDAEGIPAPPALYAEPRYIGSHAFVGRAAELAMLSNWALATDSRPVLLFEAIGGAGKSMLTWEWTVNHSSGARTDWAGKFWYSFYEKGAVMADFCRRAVAYMTGQPMAVLLEKRQPELTGLLLRHLQARPWLLVLDGFERVLVAYHRYDAAQVADEEAGRTDEIARRDPAAAIRPEDDELLRGLTGVDPSKILITSRLVPRVLLNHAGQPIPGVLREHLHGLRPADAESLLRACEVRGSSELIQDYLRRHCDCHPLVTGIVAGLTYDYLPDRGHFDAWAVDPSHGGRLNLAELDLVQKRNHILKAALAALPDKGRQLLCTLALLSEAADYELLAALNPHLPPPPVEPPGLPDWEWQLLDTPGRREIEPLARHEEYERRRRAWVESPEYQAAPHELALTVRDLERRGLLQYDRQANRYDIHPVVRGYASGSLGTEDRDRFGQQVVDYFSQRPQDLYEQAETLDDVRNGLQLVRTQLQMGRLRDAADTYRGELANALFANLEAYAEVLSLLRPIFAKDWTSTDLGNSHFANLAHDAAVAFGILGGVKQSIALCEMALLANLRVRDFKGLRINLSLMALIFAKQNRLARCNRFILLELALAERMNNSSELFRVRLDRFARLAEMGQWADAEAMWRVLDPMGRNWPRAIYRPGDAEGIYARYRFWKGDLDEPTLAKAQLRAQGARNRPLVRTLHGLRGEWLIERREWSLAAESLHEAIRMTRETGLRDTQMETRLALARFRLGRLPAAHEEANRLSDRPDPAHLALAELWHAIGDGEKAAEHARAAYRWAWADGEPYVRRYHLSRAKALLEQVGAEIPALPAYDQSKYRPLAVEEQVRVAIARLPRRV